MTRHLSKSLLAVALVVSASSANAAVLFSAGDPVGGSAFYDADFPQANGQRLVPYTSIDVPAGTQWTVNSISIVGGSAGPNQPTQMKYDFVTGIASSATRHSQASGVVGIASMTPNPSLTLNGTQNAPAFNVSVNLPTPVVLNGGTTYWVALSAIAPDSYNYWLATGSGNNAVNLPPVSTSWYEDYDTRFTPADNWAPTGIGPMAITLSGAATPEPATFGAALGVGTVVARRRRRH